MTSDGQGISAPIYTGQFLLDGIFGPVGFASHSRMEALNSVKSLAETALQHLGEWVNETEWFDLSGNEVEGPWPLLKSDDDHQVADVISQIHGLLQARGMGYISVIEHKNIFELFESADVLQWCSDTLRSRIHEFMSAERSLLADLSDEWSQS